MRLGVLTSGGDAPGMNAAVRAVTRMARFAGHRIFGFFEGYQGLINGDYRELDEEAVAGIIDMGGTFLRSSRCSEFLERRNQEKAVAVLKDLDVGGLVVIGGNGSLMGALTLHQAGVSTVGIPATIDNDLSGSDFCVGFDTAVNTVVENLSKIRDTASALERVFIVEVMGRSSGAIALRSALAGGADCVVVPEIRIGIKQICSVVEHGYKRGKTHILIVVAEGAASAYALAEQIRSCVGYEVKITVLGHIQRGGSPSALDRTIAGRLGAAAVDILTSGRGGLMVGIRGDRLVKVTLADAVRERPRAYREIYKLVQTLAR